MQVLEDNQDLRVSQAPGGTRGPQVSQGNQALEPQGRTVRLAGRVRRASLGRCWGSVLGPLDRMVFLGPLETRACLETLDALEDLVWTRVPAFPVPRASAVTTATPERPAWLVPLATAGSAGSPAPRAQPAAKGSQDPQVSQVGRDSEGTLVLQALLG